MSTLREGPKLSQTWTSQLSMVHLREMLHQKTSAEVEDLSAGTMAAYSPGGRAHGGERGSKACDRAPGCAARLGVRAGAGIWAECLQKMMGAMSRSRNLREKSQADLWELQVEVW